MEPPTRLSFADICQEIAASGKTFTRDHKGYIRDTATGLLVSGAMYGADYPFTAIRLRTPDFRAAHSLSMCEHGDEYVGEGGRTSQQFLKAVTLPPVKNPNLPGYVPKERHP